MRTPEHPEPPGAALWDFACGLYAPPGVRGICLDWQMRHGADVPLILALCWQAARAGPVPDARQLERIRRSLAPWRDATVLPLRALRGRLRPLAPAGSRAAALRAAVLQAELLAERTQLEYLAAVLPKGAAAARSGANLHDALDTYLAQLGMEEREREREIERFARQIRDSEAAGHPCLPNPGR